MKIKKHKIKVSRDDYQSSFLTDLRPEKDITSSDYREDGKRKLSKRKLFYNNFIKKNRKNKFSFIKLSRFRRIFFFPLFLLLFNLFKSLVFFLWRCLMNIVNFFKKKSFLNFNFSWKIKGQKKRKADLNKINFFNFKKTSKAKSVLFFFLFLLLLVLPFKFFTYYSLFFEDASKERIMEKSFSALEKFVLASDDISNLNLDSAQQNFFQAGQNFIALEQELGAVDELVSFLASFSSKDKIKLASESKNIASLGSYLSSSGDSLSLALDALLRSFSDSGDIDKDLSDFYFHAQQAEDDFKKANDILQSIETSSVPLDYRDDFADLKKIFNVLELNMSSLLDSFSSLRTLLGIDIDKRYLLVFQNNAEMRASGGFIGSYALLDIGQGEIKNIEIPFGGSYDTEGGLRTLVEAPKPLHLLDSAWSFWDANWWPDWRMSAQNLMWFYEKSDGPSVDGVIALNTDVLVDVLRVTGEIDMRDKFGVVVGPDNAWDVLQEIVEVTGQPELYEEKTLKTDILNRIKEEEDLASSSDKSKESFARNEPKKIIADLMSSILDKFSNNMSKDMMLESLRFLEKNLNEKNILLYFNDVEIQEEVEDHFWGGRIKNSPLDYLMIVDTNIGGGKTDRFIENNFSLDVEVDENGDIINRLRIEKKHQGVQGELFSGIRNVNWLRVYVPEGSTLIKAKGFSQPDQSYFKETKDFYTKNQILEETENQAKIDLESGTKVYQESDKTVFANWSMLDPGEEVVIEIDYKLPFNIFSEDELEEDAWFSDIFPEQKTENYSLLWQKQPGSGKANFKFNFQNNSSLNTFWSYPDFSDFDDRVMLKGDLLNDRYLVLMLK
jgi:hypothetical protein